MTSSAAHAYPNLGVVVGFDGSPHSYDALRWAAHAAGLRKTKLTVASAYYFPYTEYVQSMSGREFYDPSAQLADRALTEARQVLNDEAYLGEVEYRALTGDATDWLVRLSAEADLVVVGRRGTGGFWGQVLGSVASALPSHAHCPTVIVHSDDDDGSDNAQAAADFTADTRPVCVGVDGSDNARMAAVVAAEEAQRRGVALEVIHAQPYFTGTSSVWYLAPNEKMEEEIHSEMLTLLNTESQFIQDRVSGIEVIPTVVRQIPSEAMSECTKRAQLTVVGTRGHGGFTSLLLGSVSRSMLSHAQGTIMVIPADKN